MFLLSKMSLNVSNYCKVVFKLDSKNQFLKNLCSGIQCEGFQFLLILDLWGVSFHAVVVFGLGKDFLFKSVLGRCVVHTQRLWLHCAFFSMRKFCFYCNDQTNHLFHVLNPGCLCRGIPLANCIMTGRQNEIADKIVNFDNNKVVKFISAIISFR